MVVHCLILQIQLPHVHKSNGHNFTNPIATRTVTKFTHTTIPIQQHFLSIVCAYSWSWGCPLNVSSHKVFCFNLKCEINTFLWSFLDGYQLAGWLWRSHYPLWKWGFTVQWWDMSLNPNLSQRLQKEHWEHITIGSKNWGLILHQNKCSWKIKKKKCSVSARSKRFKRGWRRKTNKRPFKLTSLTNSTFASWLN